MKDKIIDILEKHYHGRNYIESRCADDIIELFNTLMTDNVLDKEASASASKLYFNPDGNIGWYAYYQGFDDAVDWVKNELINKKQ